VILCQCNRLTEALVTAAIAAGASRPSEVYAACGCGAQCGCCCRAILDLLRRRAGGRGPASLTPGAAPARQP
jgi:bacterioferritin-associated ferredoxin